MSSAKLINQDSGNCEWYTPIDLVNAAREVMGSIDLDPASSEKANSQIGALRYYSDNGLDRPWFGNVWMNHPFSRANNPLWVKRLVDWYESREGLQACCITFAATSETWFRPLLNYPQCFIHGRTNYYLPSGEKKTGVTKGSVITYLGNNTDKFKEVFSRFGTVK